MLLLGYYSDNGDVDYPLPPLAITAYLLALVVFAFRAIDDIVDA